MSLRYRTLSRHRATFKGMTGLTVALFDDRVWELQPALAAATRAQRERPGRQRAVGGGHPTALDGRDELLLTVIWLRHYFTQETLGYFFAVSDSTARRVIGRVLPVLEQAGRATMRQPPPSRRQRLGVAEALHAFPALADLDDESLVVDTFEQRVQRPQHRAEADRHYAGKKKRHTLKTQVVVELGRGAIRDVTPGVPGPVADPTLFTASGTVECWPREAQGLGDKAYLGVPRLHTPRRKPRGKPRPPEDVAFNRAFARVRIEVEHAIRDLRIFQALTQTDRHQRRGQVARVCAVVELRARRCRPGRRDQWLLTA
jgi:hypothetical protein